MAERKTNKLYYGYIIIAATALLAAVVGGTQRTFGVFFQPLLTEFGWTRAMTSGAFSLSSVVTGIFGITAGGLTDRFGPRIITIASGLLFALGYFLMSQVDNMQQLFLVYGLIIGLAMSGAVIPLESTVTRWFTRRRGMMLGIFHAGAGIGIMVMPPLASRLIVNYDWRNSYIILSIIALVLMMLAAQFLHHDPGQMGLKPYGTVETKVEAAAKPSTPSYSLRQAVPTVQFWIFSALTLSFSFILQSIYVHIAPHAEVLGFSAATGATILAIFGGAGTVGRLAAGALGDRLGPKLTYATCFGLMAISLFWLRMANTEWALYLFAVVFGLGYSGSIVVRVPLIAEVFGLGSLGAILGGIGIGTMIGAAIGPVFMGYIFDITDSYDAGFLINAGVAILSIALVYMLRPVKKTREISI